MYWTISLLLNIMIYVCIVGCRGASQLGGSLLGSHQGYKANKLYIHCNFRTQSVQYGNLQVFIITHV